LIRDTNDDVSTPSPHGLSAGVPGAQIMERLTSTTDHMKDSDAYPAKTPLLAQLTHQSFGFFVAVVDVVRIAFLQQAAISRSLEVNSIHIQNLLER
jgi:hypothetical protein